MDDNETRRTAMLQIEKGIDKIVKTIRVLILDQPGYLGRVATAVGNAGGNITDTHLVSYGFEYNTRDLTVFLDDEAHLQTVLAEIGTRGLSLRSCRP